MSRDRRGRLSYTLRTMIKKLTRIGDSIALVLDNALLEELGLDESSEVEVSTNGQIIVIAPISNSARERKFREAADEVNVRYAGLFQRLGE